MVFPVAYSQPTPGLDELPLRCGKFCSKVLTNVSAGDRLIVSAGDRLKDTSTEERS